VQAAHKNRHIFLTAAACVTVLGLAGAFGLAQGAPGAPGGRGQRGGPAFVQVPGYFATGANAARVQNQIPVTHDTIAVLDALPATAPAVPKKPRKIFVFARAVGFVHSNIPLAAFTMKALGDKTGAWSTTISYDLADFTAANLAQYDAIMLDNTTGTFLDDSDAAATAARHQALLDFVNSGKGLIMVHAAGDSYHDNGTGGFTPGARGAGRGAGRGEGAARGPAAAGARRGPFTPRPSRPFADAPTSLWPAYSAMVGGFFKWHWPYPQIISVHLDDPKSPILAGYHGQDFTIHDETYTFAGFSPKNVHVLTSIDYAKMSDADKAKEDFKRPDHFYALSWLHRVGNGRVFYQAHGHDEHVYANTAYLEELLAGTQYALGDLKANDAPGNVKLN
jgi:hypothetical protein